MSGPSPKADLIRRAVAGDDDAAQQLIGQYLKSGELERFIRGQKPHPNSDVDALVDDTLLEMRASITSFEIHGDTDPTPAFGAWVRNFARWNVLDDARHWRTQTQGGDRKQVSEFDIQLESEQDVLDFFADEDTSVSRIIADSKIVRKLLAVCDFLRQIAPDRDDDFFKPFELYVKNGLTRNEIAEELDMSPGQVGHSLRTSKELLKNEWHRLSAYVSARGLTNEE